MRVKTTWRIGWKTIKKNWEEGWFSRSIRRTDAHTEDWVAKYLKAERHWIWEWISLEKYRVGTRQEYRLKNNEGGNFKT